MSGVDFDCLVGDVNLSQTEGRGVLTSNPACRARFVAARKDCLRFSMSAKVMV